MLDRDAEVPRDLHRQLEAGTIVAAFEIADRLMVDADRGGQVATRLAAFGPEHCNAIVDYQGDALPVRTVVYKQQNGSYVNAGRLALSYVLASQSRVEGGAGGLREARR